MEFISLCVFHHPELPLKLKLRREINVKIIQQTRIISSLFIPTMEALIIGLSNGQIYMWRKRSTGKVISKQSLLPKEC